MSGTEFRIIDAISRGIGNPISISGLTTDIKERYGSAHYPNIYNALLSLKKEDIIEIEKQGNTSIPLLNFANYTLSDILTEMEIQKKREFLEGHPEAQFLFASLDEAFGNLSFIKSIILINPIQNMKLNRAELLLIMDEGARANSEKAKRLALALRKRHNIRMESLILTENELLDFLKSGERNPIREMLSNKIALLWPQNFWKLIRNAYIHGIRMRFDIEQTGPSKISNSDLEYNMGRFGYTELGPQIQQGTDYSIELIIASILMGEDARRTAAIPIMLAKNRANYELLAFLSYRHGFAERLLGTFIALNTIQPSPGLPDTIASMREAGTRPIQLDQNRTRELMRQYGAGPG